MSERLKDAWVSTTNSIWPRPGKCTAGEFDYNLINFATKIILDCGEMLDSYQESVKINQNLTFQQFLLEQYQLKDEK